MFWDYLSQSPEAIHQVIYLFGDRGIPDGWRKCNAYLGHTVKLVNKKGEWVYAQWHVLSDLRKKEKECTSAKPSSDRSRPSPDRRGGRQVLARLRDQGPLRGHRQRQPPDLDLLRPDLHRAGGHRALGGGEDQRLRPGPSLI